MNKYCLDNNGGWKGRCPECGCEGLHYCMGRPIIPQWPKYIGSERSDDEVHEVQWKR